MSDPVIGVLGASLRDIDSDLLRPREMAMPVAEREEAPASKTGSLTEAALDVLLRLGFLRPMTVDFRQN